MLATKLALRELYNNKKYWSVLCLNLVIGLLGFTFILIFRNNVNSSIEYKSKELLSADIVISGRRPLSGAEEKITKKILLGKVIESTEITEIYSMAQGGVKSRTRLLYVKAISENYPLIGHLDIEGQGNIGNQDIAEINKAPIIWVSPEVIHQFSVGVGSKLLIGDLSFVIKGVIKNDTTSSFRGVNLAPKVYIGQKQLEKTGLIKYGSVAWYESLYKLKDEYSSQDIRTLIYKDIKDTGIKVSTPTETGEQYGRVLNYLSDYLGLIGVVALLISGIGASYLFQSYFFKNLKQIGILKSLGVSKSSLYLLYGQIIVIVGTIASSVTSIISVLCIPFFYKELNKWISGGIEARLSYDVILSMFAVTVVLNLLICYPVLKRCFETKVNDLLSAKINLYRSKKDLLLYLPVLTFTWGLAVWQANSFKIGSVFLLSILCIFIIVIAVFPFLFERISIKLKKMELSKPFGLSSALGVRFLVRGRVSSTLAILSMTTGLALISVVVQLEKNLKDQLTDTSSDRPSLFIFDIQEQQGSKLSLFAKKNNIPLRRPTPMVRARLVKKNNEPLKRKVKKGSEFSTREEEARRRFNNRGINLTYGDRLNESEKIVKGSETFSIYSGEGIAEISLEKRYAKRLEVGIGDTLTFEILGVEVQGIIKNLRQIKWTSFLPNFFISFQPGVIGDAPKTYIASVDAVSFERQLDIQDLIVEKFPNLSIVNVSEIITKVFRIFDAMAWAIAIMGIGCVLVGLTVLFSIVQNQLKQSIRDIALLKVLGMDHKKSQKLILVQYLSLVILAGVLGLSVGVMLSSILGYLLLDGVVSVEWKTLLTILVSNTFIAYLIILLSFKFSFRMKIIDGLGR